MAAFGDDYMERFMTFLENVGLGSLVYLLRLLPFNITAEMVESLPRLLIVRYSAYLLMLGARSCAQVIH